MPAEGVLNTVYLYSGVEHAEPQTISHFVHVDI